jgi:TetR/AcrR family transcriptional regulator, cholesterol catabolism regulator
MASRGRKAAGANIRNADQPRRRSAAILDAAAQIFADRGFHGASTQDIADVLGIRQASLYYYFPSKEVALEEVCLRGVEGFLERAVAIAGASGKAREKIQRIMKAHLTPLTDRSAYVRTFLNERQHLSTDSRRRIGRLSRAYERLIEDVLKSGVRDGEFRRDLDCRLATLAFLAMINGVAAWYGKEPKTTIDKVASEYVRVFFSGIGIRSMRNRTTPSDERRTPSRKRRRRST